MWNIVFHIYSTHQKYFVPFANGIEIQKIVEYGKQKTRPNKKQVGIA